MKAIWGLVHHWWRVGSASLTTTYRIQFSSSLQSTRIISLVTILVSHQLTLAKTIHMKRLPCKATMLSRRCAWQMYALKTILSTMRQHRLGGISASMMTVKLHRTSSVESAALDGINQPVSHAASSLELSLKASYLTMSTQLTCRHTSTANPTLQLAGITLSITKETSFGMTWRMAKMSGNTKSHLSNSVIVSTFHKDQASWASSRLVILTLASRKKLLNKWLITSSSTYLN